ncbi:MAG: hypothetical protein H0T42_25645 [Deltaproteobacteria bacterium]|nr:hypothetical protein [Deltaproteobacteria bacterium]
MEDLIYMIAMSALGAIVVPTWYFSKGEKRKRKLRKARRWSLAELPEGTFGKVVGTARIFEDTLTAPISGRPCVFYQIVVSYDDARSSQLLKEAIGVPFIIEDETGRAVVDPRGAEVLLVQDRFRISGELDATTPVEAALLSRHAKLRGPGTKLWYRESIIEAGEVVAIYGAGGHEPDPEASPAAEYRGAPSMRLRLSSARSYTLLLSDDPVMVA